jgi:hypothetical protein
MDIDPQRKTWSNFTKITFYAGIVIVTVLVMMALFLL